MDLLQLMDNAEDQRHKALDRLEAIVALYQSDDPAVREEAMGRAMVFCGKEWGGYAAGLDLLAARHESRDQPLPALRLREEAEDPGTLIRQTETALAEAAKMTDERSAIISRYGSEEAALGPTALELMFIQAAEFLSDDSADPWAPLAGWSVPWHPIPDELAHSVTIACPLPESIADARAECLSWEERLAELAVLADGPGNAVLPTACTARHRLVQDLWARELPAQTVTELHARLDFWTSRGGDDGRGYGVLAADLARLTAQGIALGQSEGSKSKCHRLRRDNPHWSLARIGKELGISRQAVHKHLKS
ncbi:HTH domain-containing protein [Magnetospirillum sulfuroxidans]|uniref:HTH domain-containing protein n=1 Tax=Magnetospirillum sulfuroxidans TaxID=611300 RepID=A0ABS5I862_9PROT|nr:HTH domain-containing protein [Magnetospirillum sulfuroxidans]MBR9970622.1 HTH domain-containing protein [Magnetospirillum sulfuroxidans]